MDLDNVTRKLQLSVDLVNEWGETELPNGKRLAEMFTYDSVSFWDIVAVIVALYHVPKALSLWKRPPSFLPLIMTYLRWGKYSIINKKYYIRKKQCHDWPSKPVFMFLGFIPRVYYDTLQPVVRNMVNDKEICPVSLYDYLSLQKQHPEIQGGEFQSIWQHWDSDVKADAYNLINLLKKDIKELKDMRVLPQIIQNRGESLWLQMKDTFDWLFISYLPYLMKHFAIARHILECHRPEAIISPEVSEPRNRLYCLLGKHLKIPTLIIQCGAYEQEAVEWQFFVADHIAAWGETSRNAFLMNGVPAEKIFLSGPPRHDSMVSTSNTEVLQTRSSLGIPDGALMILFASTYLSIYDQIEDPFLLDSVKRAIFQAADQSNGICLVVKPHPAEKVSTIKKLAKGHRNILLVHKNDDIEKLVMACDAFMSLGSTTTMDAIIANKPTICPNFPGWIWSNLFVNSGATLVPKSKDELIQCFESLKNGDCQKILADLEPARQRFLQQAIFKSDGKASNRIKSLLLDMAKTAGSSCK